MSVAMEIEGKFSPAFAVLMAEAEAVAKDATLHLFPRLGVGRPGRILDRMNIRNWWVLGSLPDDLSALHTSDLLFASSAAFSVEDAWRWAWLPHDGAMAVTKRLFAERAVRGIDSGGVMRVAA